MTQPLDEAVLAIQQQILDQARETYSAQVLDHWQRPRNPGTMVRPSGHARVTGPCQDTMELFIQVQRREQEELILQASFLTDGCITSIASASAAVELATGRELLEARLVTGEEILEALGGLPAGNEHCATLAADTLGAAIDDYMGAQLAGRAPHP